MYKSEVDAWKKEKKKMDEIFRKKMMEVLVCKGKSQIFDEQSAVSEKYAMDNLLFMIAI